VNIQSAVIRPIVPLSAGTIYLALKSGPSLTWLTFVTHPREAASRDGAYAQRRRRTFSSRIAGCNPSWDTSRRWKEECPRSALVWNGHTSRSERTRAARRTSGAPWRIVNANLNRFTPKA